MKRSSLLASLALSATLALSPAAGLASSADAPSLPPVLPDHSGTVSALVMSSPLAPIMNAISQGQQVVFTTKFPLIDAGSNIYVQMDADGISHLCFAFADTASQYPDGNYDLLVDRGIEFTADGAYLWSIPGTREVLFVPAGEQQVFFDGIVLYLRQLSEQVFQSALDQGEDSPLAQTLGGIAGQQAVLSALAQADLTPVANTLSESVEYSVTAVESLEIDPRDYLLPSSVVDITTLRSVPVFMKIDATIKPEGLLQAYQALCQAVDGTPEIGDVLLGSEQVVADSISSLVEAPALTLYFDAAGNLVCQCLSFQTVTEQGLASYSINSGTFVDPNSDAVTIATLEVSTTCDGQESSGALVLGSGTLVDHDGLSAGLVMFAEALENNEVLGGVALRLGIPTNGTDDFDLNTTIVVYEGAEDGTAQLLRTQGNLQANWNEAGDVLSCSLAGTVEAAGQDPFACNPLFTVSFIEPETFVNTRSEWVSAADELTPEAVAAFYATVAEDLGNVIAMFSTDIAQIAASEAAA